MAWNGLFKHGVSTLRIVGEAFLILLGILGLLLPIIPGWIFIGMGIVLLAPNTQIAKWLRRAFEKAAAKLKQKN